MTNELEAAFRAEWPRILASLIRYTGSVELAEDAVQEAVARALVARDRGLLINPAAWLTTVAKRIAIDAVRRDVALRERYPLLVAERARDDRAPRAAAAGGDDRLDLLLLACAPEFPAETRLALALRFVLGVRTEAIADALLVDHRAMSARLTRVKRRIEAEGIRFDHELADLDARLADVLATIHVLYTTGHTVVSGNALRSEELTGAAIELARAVRRARPESTEVAGVLAVLLLTEARSPTRVDASGRLVTLEHADRSRWDVRMRREGLELATAALPGGGRFALEAGIAGLHTDARSWAETDWRSIGLLYDRLIEIWPSPAAALARIVARSYGSVGPRVALEELEAVESSGPIAGASARQLLAVRADLLRRSGRGIEARAAYLAAAAAEQNDAVRAFLEARSAALD